MSVPLRIITPDDVRASVRRAKRSLEKAAEEVVWQIEHEAWVTLGYASWNAMREAEYGDAAFMLPRNKGRPELVSRMRAKGLTQQEIADTAGIHRRSVERDLNAHMRNEDPAPTITNTRGQQRPATYARTETGERVNTETGRSPARDDRPGACQRRVRQRARIQHHVPHMRWHGKGHTMNVKKIMHKAPRNFPGWIREAAESRGYGDAIEPLSLFVHENDIDEAFACAAQGNGSRCVMAQAGRRLGAEAVYFYRTTAYVDFGSGPVVRFRPSRSIYANVIAPFDRGSREEVQSGVYHLMPPSPSEALGARDYRKERAEKRDGTKTGRNSLVHLHTERVVMASRAA